MLSERIGSVVNNNEKQLEPASLHYPVIVVGAGQAGLSASYFLQQQQVDHLVFDKDHAMHVWEDQRWDNFSLVTPNWQCKLPDHPYVGQDPDGFMTKQEIVGYLQQFKQKVDPPIAENTKVIRLYQNHNGQFVVHTQKSQYLAEHVIVATGGYHTPNIPPYSKNLPKQIVQIDVTQYRNSKQLPAGAVLVVGSGQSGCQIAEDLHLEGRQVWLSTGSTPRVARFYRGKDVVRWLSEMGHYDQTVTEHPTKKMGGDHSNHYVTGRDGGRDIDLRQFAREGMNLTGRLTNIDGEQLYFRGDLADNLDRADATYNRICLDIDRYIVESKQSAVSQSHYRPIWFPELDNPIRKLSIEQSHISSVIWCCGFKTNFEWIKIPIFNNVGYPQHQRGISNVAGLYFIGLPWLHSWGSGRFLSIASDAKHVVADIVQRL